MDTHLLAKLGTLRQLEIFLKVAEVGGIALAAEQLYLTQPSVSIQVRKLSEAVGMPLYEVIGRRLSLTEAGRQVEIAAREILGTLDRLNSSLNDIKGLQAGILRIAVDSSAKY
ncbi:MAG: LysR family transcriptional regulator, partial [Haliea sp.]